MSSDYKLPPLPAFWAENRLYVISPFEKATLECLILLVSPEHVCERKTLCAPYTCLLHDVVKKQKKSRAYIHKHTGTELFLKKKNTQNWEGCTVVVSLETVGNGKSGGDMTNMCFVNV